MQKFILHRGKQLIALGLILIFPTTQLHAGMIATDRVVSDLSFERGQIQNFLSRGEIQKKLTQLGISSEEAQQRVATLSDAEVQKVAGQLQNLPAGGDGIYLGLGTLILLAILLVLIFR